MVLNDFFDKNALFALFHHLAPPSDPSAPALMFSHVKSTIWGENSALFRKNVLFALFPLWAPESERLVGAA